MDDRECIKHWLQKVKYKGRVPKVIADAQLDKRVFNRRFKFIPKAIVFCESAEQVANAIRVAKFLELPLRVRSGGHDHEGECSGTNAIVIDFKNMNNFTLNHKDGTATIQPGVRFQDIIPSLDENMISIPHGTCESVGVMGFTLGGGWGPWTRLHGMCCERLIGATIVLGDGTVKKIKEGDKNQELLWALRGGGGFSYGIVTELIIKTFKQPEHTIKFTCIWKNSKAIEVLELWEKVIRDDTPQLIGTNLQIMAIPENNLSLEDSIHKCTFYGYYSGSEKQLEDDIHNNWFPNLQPDESDTITSKSKQKMDFSSWHMISTAKQKMELKGESQGLMFIPPDKDHPAPHKLSCRLVKEDGLGNECRKNLIKSLRSDLITKEGQDAHIHTYVTLGAITGPFYKSYVEPQYPNGSSFPFKKRPYTIQYQAWWDEENKDKVAGEHHYLDMHINQAMDWIAECRTMHFPQTEGSFISFKDSAIPTRNYFLQNYEKLQDIKRKYSNDPQNIFRSRKTIL